MTRRVELLNIVEKKHLNSDTFTLELQGGSTLPDIKPGQFVQVKIDGGPGTFLRRPFSIHDIDSSVNTLKLLVRIAGKGTLALSKLEKGDLIDIIYPLGNSFSIPGANKKVLLAGGGCGIAPLLFLGKNLKSKGLIPDILLGFKTRDSILEHEEYRSIGPLFIATEDGSEGIRGVITDHPVLSGTSYDMIYCCGPEPMMKAFARYSSENRVNCEVSLENLMGCGIGACLCCVVQTVDGHQCTCTEGPVFNTRKLKW
jgi:dihydroorotate dehydrogenase electron transfer subunit